MRNSRQCRRLGIIVLLTMLALPCLAAEVAVLKNGFSIKHERREVVGDVTRLYVNADGSSFVDVPTSEIEHFEAAADETASGAARNTTVRNAGNQSVANQNALKQAPGFPARPVPNLSEVVNEASDRYRLDPDLVNSVIKAESDFHVRAVSPKGAQGLMQLMPGTASQLGVSNAFDPKANVEGGTKYLRELLERYNFDLVKALAAYNAGPQRVEQFGGVPPYYETRAYVARIVKDFNRKKIAQGKTETSAAKSAKSTQAGATSNAAHSTHSANKTSTTQATAAQK